MTYSMLLPVLLSMSLAQAQPGPSLYVVELGQIDERLVRIALDGENKLQKETVVITRRLKQPSFFKFQKIELVGDRYVVSGYGGIIDIKNRKIINDERQWGTLLGIDGQKVVYGVLDGSPDGVETPKDRRGNFVFDLQAEKLEKLDKPGIWNLPGVWSADKSLRVTSERSAPPKGRAVLPFAQRLSTPEFCQISLHRADGTSKILAGGYEIDYAKIVAYTRPKLPLLWLDNEHILTQKKNGLLVVLDLEGKEQTVAEIGDAPAVFGPPRLWVDPQKRIIYTCYCHQDWHTDEYLVDVKAKSVVPLEKYALGHGFEASVKPVDGLYGVFHEGKLIGKRAQAVNPQTSRTGPGIIGTICQWPPAVGKGIAVWDVRLQDWREIALGSVVLVGWSK